MLPTLSLLLVRLFGLGGFISGIIWILSPAKYLRYFGLPQTYITPQTCTLCLALGARNSAAGLVIILVSLYASKELTAAVLAVFATACGTLDTVVCLRAGVERGREMRWAGHLVNLGICCGIVGALVLS
ncbi:DUF4267 domain-containing protein [Aspergillus stella-maris]|uniref:DUF4267 domain-containing protein n=1 Tax=Aspergillus stella-maris TaxID=1810926 RepID=UPI003CCD3866